MNFLTALFLFLTAFSSIDTDKLRLVLDLIHLDQVAQWLRVKHQAPLQKPIHLDVDLMLLNVEFVDHHLCRQFF